jgi:Leucine-rich repeat (LRR) protein
VGAQWESAAYDFRYYCNQFKDNKEAVYQSLLYDSKVSSESDENLNNWWKSLSQEWRLVFNINYFLQSREYYPTLHERFKGMMTLGVFESIYGNEKMEALLVKNPDLNELRNMVSMKILYASGCNIKELSPLKIFKNLKIVELEANPIENLNGLEFQKDLEDLTIVMYDNWPTQKAIETLVKIKDLTFDPQNQQEFDMIGNMPDLRTFYTYLNFEPEIRN